MKSTHAFMFSCISYLFFYTDSGSAGGFFLLQAGNSFPFGSSRWRTGEKSKRRPNHFSLAYSDTLLLTGNKLSSKYDLIVLLNVTTCK